MFDFIDWIMFLPKEEEKLFHQELEQLEQEKKMKYINSVERKGMEKGRQEGEKKSLLLVLRTKFGRIPKGIKDNIEEISSPQKLASLLRQAVRAESLADLKIN